MYPIHCIQTLSFLNIKQNIVISYITFYFNSIHLLILYHSEVNILYEYLSNLINIDFNDFEKNKRTFTAVDISGNL